MTDLLGTSPAQDLEQELERHRTALTGYCYRMLGSIFEAEDAVQEAMVRAWRSHGSFEGRSAFKSWLYRIATNVCMDMLNGRERRARPMDFGDAQAPVIENLGAQLPEATWILPAPDGRVVAGDGDPAELAAARETLKLAFMAALQHLPPRQRAGPILREALREEAAEAAELLGTSVASVNSALQRARATLDSLDVKAEAVSGEVDEQQRALLDRYLDTFERYDMEALTALLAEDATLSMPPYALWMRGPRDIVAWMLGPGHGCQGSRMLPTQANGMPAFGQYRPSPDGGHVPWGLHVVETDGERITGINVFLDTANLFPLFGLPPRL
jgi:RNA polymerase sigma-70 factor (ECF subfamily)